MAEKAARHVPAGAHAQARHRHGSCRCANTTDPVFWSITAPETFAPGGTIYVFTGAKRIALGGTSQGGVFEARRSTKAAAGDAGRGQQAELWGDEQWQVLKSVIEEHKPRTIGINRSTVFAFSDGLSSGELKGMTAALGDTWTSRFKDAEALPLELIASRLPEEEAFYAKMQALVWSMTQTMFSSAVITPGKTKTSDLVWWWRQRVNDQGLGTWFQPSVEVQRGRDRRRARRRSDHPARRRASLRRRHHRSASQHRHAAQRRAAAGRNRRPRGCAARQRQRPPGHRHGRSAPDAPATRSSRRHARG